MTASKSLSKLCSVAASCGTLGFLGTPSSSAAAVQRPLCAAGVGGSTLRREKTLQREKEAAGKLRTFVTNEIQGFHEEAAQGHLDKEVPLEYYALVSAIMSCIGDASYQRYQESMVAPFIERGFRPKTEQPTCYNAAEELLLEAAKILHKVKTAETSEARDHGNEEATKLIAAACNVAGRLNFLKEVRELMVAPPRTGNQNVKKKPSQNGPDNQPGKESGKGQSKGPPHLGRSQQQQQQQAQQSVFLGTPSGPPLDQNRSLSPVTPVQNQSHPSSFGEGEIRTLSKQPPQLSVSPASRLGPPPPPRSDVPDAKKDQTEGQNRPLSTVAPVKSQQPHSSLTTKTTSEEDGQQPPSLQQTVALAETLREVEQPPPLPIQQEQQQRKNKEQTSVSSDQEKLREISRQKLFKFAADQLSVYNGKRKL